MTPASAPVDRREFLQRLVWGAGVVALGRPAFAAAPPRRKLGIALAGLGSYSTHQLAPALKQTEWCELRGVITGDRAKGERWSREHGFPASQVFHYNEIPRLATVEGIDIVYIVTPPGLHARDTIAAARAGKHVICEKPMANTVAECDAMLAACRAASVKLSIGYRLQFEPHHRELDRLATEQPESPFRQMSGSHSFHLRGRAWRVDRALAGGGPLMDLGVYVIQAACRAAGGAAPLAVTAKERPKQNPSLFNEVEEGIDFTLFFPHDARCDGATSYADRGNDFRAEGNGVRVELQPAYSYGGIQGRTHLGPMRFPNVNQQALQMDDFARCIQEERESPVPGEMGRMHLAVIEAIYEAARTGRRVDVQA